MQLSDKLSSRKARLGVIGLGYVGLPLSMEMAEAGFHVVGIDADERKVAEIAARRSYIADVPTEVLEKMVAAGRFEATTDPSVLATLDAVSICVPTPLSKTKDPDVSYILDAVAHIKKHIHPGQLIVLESTTYPGTTDELIRAELETDGMRAGREFYLAFSPERIDPGNQTHGTKNTPKVVGGITPRCTELATLLYSQFIDRVHPVSSARAAEMVKLLENTFRSVNIGLVNEIAQMCDVLGIDAYEVIEAAATKPFGFMPFYPGPGLGGHCIPIDPHYLAWKMKAHDFTARFIGLAAEVNQEMPHLVVDKVAAGLNYHGKPVKGSRILALGVAYKKDVSDMRESPAIEVIDQLTKRGAIVKYHDPYVPELILESGARASVPLTDDNLRLSDCVVILTDHRCFDIPFIVKHSRLVVDTRNSTRGLEGQYGERIMKLGAPAPFAMRAAHPGEAA
ncbi:MAG TPA: nucleotide sugar dehydrogenase [Candidatus Binatia bacterium]|nr:nucleotide sugar dehydrogenase [Candidatus Binatia bacterium]